MTVLKSIPCYKDEDNETGCCPKFHPEKWDRKQFDFSDLYFVKANSNSFMHVPLNLGTVMTEVQKRIDRDNAQPDHSYLILSKDLSSFESTHYFNVTDNMHSMPLEKVKGIFNARVFEGKFNQIPKWMSEVETERKTKGLSTKEHYVFYTTCPKCAKVYGHNYIVIFTR